MKTPTQFSPVISTFDSDERAGKHHTNRGLALRETDDRRTRSRREESHASDHPLTRRPRDDRSDGPGRRRAAAGRSRDQRRAGGVTLPTITKCRRKPREEGLSSFQATMVPSPSPARAAATTLPFAVYSSTARAAS